MPLKCPQAVPALSCAELPLSCPQSISLITGPSRGFETGDRQTHTKTHISKCWSGALLENAGQKNYSLGFLCSKNAIARVRILYLRYDRKLLVAVPSGSVISYGHFVAPIDTYRFVILLRLTAK